MTQRKPQHQCSRPSAKPSPQSQDRLGRRSSAASTAPPYYATPAHSPATRAFAAPLPRPQKTESASIRSARSPVQKNARPAPEYLRAYLATAATLKEKHKSDETDPAGTFPRAPALPDRDASPPPPAHPRSPAYLRQSAPLLPLPARAAAWLAWPAACRQSHPERSFHGRLARTFQHAGPPRRKMTLSHKRTIPTQFTPPEPPR